jgi:hypothetical protein
MGMDILLGRGLLVGVDQVLAPLLTCHDLALRDQGVALFFQRRENDDESELNESTKACLDALRSSESAEDMRNALSEMVQKAVDALSEEDTCVLWDGSDELQLLKAMCAVFLPVEPTEIRRFTSGRVNGDEVPVDEPVFVFPFEKLFRVQLTSAGRSMAAITGEDSPKTWTILSV